MHERQPYQTRLAPLDDERLAWPDFPQVATTLLAAVGVAAVFLGLGTLTAQPWMTWLGLVIAAVVLASHVVRHRRAEQWRARTQALLGARLMSLCHSPGGPNFLRLHHDGSERLVLALTDDALHIGHAVPLEIFATIPLYDIDDVQVGPVPDPKWNSDEVSPSLPDERDVLNLAVRRSGQRVHRLAFSHFERHAPSPLWADMLRQSATRPTAGVG